MPASPRAAPWQAWPLAIAVTLVVHAAILVVPIAFRLARPTQHEVVTLRFVRPKPTPPIVEPPQPKPPEEPLPEPTPLPSKTRRPRTVAPSTEAAPASEPTPPAAAVPVVEAVATAPSSQAPVVAAVDEPVPVPPPIPRPPSTRTHDSVGDRDQLLGYARGVRAALMRHRNYPSVAIRLGLEGSVRVELSIDRAGRLVGAPTIKQSSGHDLLDEAALRAVEAAAPFAPLPEVARKDVVPFVLHIDFFLEDATR